MSETHITLKTDDQEAGAWQAAADRSSMSRHAWLKLMANIACGRSSIADLSRRMKAARKVLEENAPIPYALKSEVGVDDNTHERFARLAARMNIRIMQSGADIGLPTLGPDCSPDDIGQWLQALDPTGCHTARARTAAILAPYDLFAAWAAVAEFVER